MIAKHFSLRWSMIYITTIQTSIKETILSSSAFLPFGFSLSGLNHASENNKTIVH